MMSASPTQSSLLESQSSPRWVTKSISRLQIWLPIIESLTPTDAATRVVPDRMELSKKLQETQTYFGELLNGRLEAAHRRLIELAGRRAFRRPLDRVNELNQRLDEIGERFQRGMKRCLERGRERVETRSSRLEALSPLNVLRRGYSLTLRASDNQVVRRADEVQASELLVTTLQHGQIVSRVVEISASKMKILHAV